MPDCDINAKCEHCNNWAPFTSSNPDYGECRAEAPRVIPMLLMFRTNIFQNLSVIAQNQSKLWPVTHKDEGCMQHVMD